MASLGAALALAACTVPAVIATGAATGGIAVSQERGPGAAISDNAIAAEINQRWLAEDWKIFRDVSTSVSEGRVMLTGKVAREKDRAEAVKLTWEVPGVKDVYDEIQVSSGGDVVDYTRDAWISAQLKTDMTFDEKILAINYNVVTVGGTIYLLGIAQNQDEINRIMRYARNVRYVKNVVSHVVLKNDPSRHAEAKR